jgi:hypothetical protein
LRVLSSKVVNRPRESPSNIELNIATVFLVFGPFSSHLFLKLDLHLAWSQFTALQFLGELRKLNMSQHAFTAPND